MRKVNTQRRRAIKATLITLAIIMLIPISGFAQEKTQNSTQLFSIMSTIASKSFSDASDADSLSEESSVPVDIEQLANNMGVKTSKSLPEVFLQECFDASNEDNLLVDEQGCLLSFTTNDDPETEYQNIAQRLEENGWTSVQSGSDAQGTFIKSTGDIRWVYVTCLDMCGEACVVIQTTSDSR